MTDCTANDIYQVINDILSRPDTKVYTKNSKIYLNISSQGTPISGDLSVNELFESISNILI